MTKPAPELEARIYFGALNVLLVEANALESEILAQVFSGFRVRSTSRLASTVQAQNHLERDAAQLVVVGTTQPEDGPDEFDFIRWVRRSKIAGIRTASVILLAGHTMQSNILRARDCGANFVIAKPITPKVLYDRVVWLAKDARPFIEGTTYTGPDRRFQKMGPPPGLEGRRSDDLSLKLGEAKAPNLSQSEIDAMLGGKGAALR